MSIIGMDTVIRFPDGRKVLEVYNTETQEKLWVITSRSFVGNETTLLSDEVVLTDKMSAVHYLMAEKRHIWTKIKTHQIHLTPRGYYTEYTYEPSWYSNEMNVPQKIWFVVFSKKKPTNVDFNVKVHWKILSVLMEQQSRNPIRMIRVTKLHNVRSKILLKSVSEKPSELVFRKITHSVVDREYHRAKTFSVPGYSDFFVVKLNDNEIRNRNDNKYTITEKTTGMKVTTCWNKKDAIKHLVDFLVSKNITQEYFAKRLKCFA